MKKILTILMVAAMLVCALAGCGKTDAPAQDPTGNVETAGPAGMLVLSTEASVKITYDSDAMVTELEGINDYGIILVDEYAGFEGKSCADVVKDLINAAVNAGNLSPDIKNVVIKLAVGSAKPGTNFLERVSAEAQNALTAAGSASKLVVIDETGLDEDGYINLDNAKVLLMNHLGVEKLDAYYGSTTPSNDLYICTVEAGGEESSWTIDAVTGLISEATEEELMSEPEEIETSEEYDYFGEEEAAASEAEQDVATEPVIEDPTITEPVVEEPEGDA